MILTISCLEGLTERTTHMSILSELKVVSDLSSVGFNTNTLFDLATGKFVQGFDGEWYLSGGP